MWKDWDESGHLHKGNNTRELFHYISANFKIFEHHDLLDFFHICIFDSYLKMISIEFGIKNNLYSFRDIALLSFVFLPLVTLLCKCKIYLKLSKIAKQSVYLYVWKGKEF